MRERILWFNFEEKEFLEMFYKLKTFCPLNVLPLLIIIIIFLMFWNPERVT